MDGWLQLTGFDVHDAFEENIISEYFDCSVEIDDD